MTWADTLSGDELRQVQLELSRTAPLKLLLEMCLSGKPTVGAGHADLDVAAMEIKSPVGGEPSQLVFPTCYLANRFARFFDLGPRPRLPVGGALGILRTDLDDPESRVSALSYVPPEVRDSLCRQRTIRWSLAVVDRETDGENFSKSVEVLDCGEGGIWLVLPPFDDDDPSLAMLLPTDSTTVWRMLSTLLPDADEWQRIVPPS